MGNRGDIFGNSMQLARHHSPEEPGGKLEFKPEPKAKLESKPTPKAKPESKPKPKAESKPKPKARIQTEAEGRIQTEAKAEGENHRLLEKETTWLAETWERRCSSAAFRLRSRPSRGIPRTHAAWRRRSRRPWHGFDGFDNHRHQVAGTLRGVFHCFGRSATSPDRVSLERP